MIQGSRGRQAAEDSVTDSLLCGTTEQICNDVVNNRLSGFQKTAPGHELHWTTGIVAFPFWFTA